VKILETFERRKGRYSGRGTEKSGGSEEESGNNVKEKDGTLRSMKKFCRTYGQSDYPGHRGGARQVN